MPVVGLLDGDLQRAIYEGFKGRLLTGTVRRYSAPQSGALDDRGRPIDGSEYEEWAVEGFRDEYSRYTMEQAGIPATDYKVCILAGSAPSWSPKLGDLVLLSPATGAYWSRLRGGKGGIRTDPATALWELQAFPAESPE